MTQGIQIERSRHAQEFVIVGNPEARDARLSFRARGLHHHLLSLPSGWRTTTSQLAADNPEGRDAIRSALGELLKLGYVTKTKQQDKAGRWSTTMIVHDKPQVSPGHTEDGFPGVGKPGVGFPGVGFPGVGFPGAIERREPKTVKEDGEKNAVAPEARPGPEAMVSRRAHGSAASDRVLTNQDKIDGTRFAIAAVHGESWNKTISDDEALALFTLKAPRNGRVTSVTAYMTKILADAPFDTFLGQLDNVDDDGADDYDLAEEQARAERQKIINGDYDEQPFPCCPRCAGFKYAIGASGVCVGCDAELWSAKPSEYSPSTISAVSKALFVATGKSPGDDWCARVAAHILDGRGIKGTGHRNAYVASVITDDPNPARFLPTPVPPKAPARVA